MTTTDPRYPHYNEPPTIAMPAYQEQPVFTGIRLPDGDQVPQPPARKPLCKRTWVRVTGAILAGFTGLIVITSALSHPGTVTAAKPASPPASSAPASPAPAASTPAAPPANTPPASTPPASTPPANDPAPAVTTSQQQALDSAQSYLTDGTGFSRAGLIDQLSSPYGEKFSVADATWAVDHSGADWDAQAVISAKGYMSDGSGFSRSGLIDQLTSQYGEKFTLAQATYAANQVGL